MIGKAICTVIMAGGIGYMLGNGFDQIQGEADIQVCASNNYIPVYEDNRVFCKRGQVLYYPEDIE